MRRVGFCLVLFAVGCGGDGPKPSGGDPFRPGDPSPSDSFVPGDLTPADSAGDTTPAPRVSWANLQFPTSHTGLAGSTFDVFGRVFAPGVTDGAGQGSGITAEAGFGSASAAVESWTWVAATYNNDADVANDEYRATVTLPLAAGGYRYAYRFRLYSGPWTYADLDSTDNGFAVANAGELTVEVPPLPAVDWCRLEQPSLTQVAPNGTSAAITGQVYEAGITQTGDPAGLEAQLGLGLDASVPDEVNWTWVAATFDSHQGNNDQYTQTLVAPDAAGTQFDFAYRFRLSSGGDWLYCDLDGSAVDGYAPAQAGSMVVDVQSIGWAKLQFPTGHTGVTGSQFTVFGRVFVAGVTDAVGQGSGITAEAGFGLASTAVEAWTWTAATYNLDVDTANDEYQAVVTLPSVAATYRYAYRFRLLAGPWTYADLDSTDNGFAVDNTGVLTVESPPLPAVDWCRLENPPTISIGPGQTSSAIAGQVYESGITEGGDPAGVEAQIGLGPDDSFPDEVNWTWTAAAFDSHQGNNDQYSATLVAPNSPGASLDYAFRFRLTAGGDWLYCDLDGSAINGYTSVQAGSMLVAAGSVDWAKTVTPPDSAKVLPGAPVRSLVRVYDDPLTKSAGMGAGLEVEMGIGPDGTDPASAGGWTFSAATYSGDATSEGGTPLADDMFGWVGVAPGTVGVYDIAARARVTNGPWLYADASGSDGAGDPYAAASALSLTVMTMPADAAVTWCRLQWIEGASSSVTEQLTVASGAVVGLAYGQVYADALGAKITGTSGSGPTPHGQVGYGNDGTDPSTHASWVWTAPGAFHVFFGDNDEQLTVLVAPTAAGTYDWTWRFSVDGTTWLYCDANGATNPGEYDSAQAGALLVQ